MTGRRAGCKLRSMYPRSLSDATVECHSGSISSMARDLLKLLPFWLGKVIYSFNAILPYYETAPVLSSDKKWCTGDIV